MCVRLQTYKSSSWIWMLSMFLICFKLVACLWHGLHYVWLVCTIILWQQHVRERNVSRSQAIRLLNVPPKSWQGTSNSQIFILQFCTTVSLTTEMTDHVKKCTSMKINDVPQSIKYHCNDLYLWTMVNKHAEQPTNQLWIGKKMHVSWGKHP